MCAGSLRFLLLSAVFPLPDSCSSRSVLLPSAGAAAIVWLCFLPLCAASLLLCPASPAVSHLAGMTLQDLRNQPYRRADAMRKSVRKRMDEQTLRVSGEVSL
ncbi:hypothetical protein chiPu_0017850 [Chiloscyllium punctatum]|uniref:Uncharacterized protein n=1 Tax=Chiloscyllium punctatum TaxID=137246 RepID=A0A401RJ81_CHIPU|nr:hypothetical protein [Chiloscyllium punctatum]